MEAGSYRLRVDASGTATLADRDGHPWADLATTFAIDGLEERDVTISQAAPTVREGHPPRISIRSSSSRWPARELALTCHDDALEIGGRVEGNGEIADCRLVGGWIGGSVDRAGAGAQAREAARSSRPSFASVFSPEPAAPPRRLYGPREPVSLDVTSASYPEPGHWMFTPPPFCFALARGAADDPGRLPLAPWLGVGLAAKPGAYNFSAFTLDGGDKGFSFRLPYEGHTRVDGSWATPALVFYPDVPDPYAAIARHTAWLRARDLVRNPEGVAVDWWSRPLFCGWGEQVWLAREHSSGERFWAAAPGYSRQDLYDRFLETLTSARLNPGTIVIDDKWQHRYALPEPDRDKWPDMRGWIARRHDEARRVLLWWNAWSAEGIPSGQTVRDRDGRTLTADPSNPAFETHLRSAVAEMLDADGLDADGFKVDFTASTPTGAGLSHHGPEWGVELLHKLIATIHDAAHAAKRDALVVTHTPNPYFAPVSDMIRLNDVLRLEDRAPDYPVVDEMRHRARVARAACPELLIDTDNWPCPTRDAWRAYIAAQPELGVPSLYYATHIDISGERLDEEDYAAVRDAWARYEAHRGGIVPRAAA